jgi:hypothetical protein
VPLHRIREGPMLPIKSGISGFTCLSRVILAKISDGSMAAHTKGCERNLPVETLI